MNEAKAKSILGIPKHQSTRGQSGIDLAMKSAKTAIVKARRAGDEEMARLCSEAREFFRRRIGNRCGCGVKINANATTCRTCATIRRVTLPNQPPTTTKRRTTGIQNSNARVPVAPAGGLKAELGYFTAPVQRVIKEWSSTVRADWLEEYFLRVAMPVVLGNKELAVRCIVPAHWRLIFELGEAITSVMEQRDQPDSWLLESSNVSTNGRFPSWNDVAREIEARGGPKFRADHLANRSLKLQLNTPADLRREYLVSRAS